MIDTHCHLLAGVDDGPRDLDESLRLVDELLAAGVTAVVCTPHMSRRYPTPEELARERFELLRERVGGEVHLELSAEIGPERLLGMDEEKLRRLAIGRRFVLVELEPATPSTFLRVAAAHLAEHELTPVFAHPERCRAVQRDLSAIDAVREDGACTQVVASSVAGSWGEAIRHTAWTLLSSGRADVLASDAHRPQRSGNRLADVLAELAQRLGDAEVRRLTVEAPGRLLA